MVDRTASERDTLAHSLMHFSCPHYKLTEFEIIQSEGYWIVMGTAIFACGCIKRFGARGKVPEDILDELLEGFMDYVTEHGVPPTLPQGAVH